MFAKQSSPIINPRTSDGSNVGARYSMNKRGCVRDGRSSTVYMIVRGVRLVATTRGQEVHLIRGSEWQTGVRLCPTGVRTALHQGFEPDRRAVTAAKTRRGHVYPRSLSPSNAMIANLISSRSLISSEEGGVSFRPLRRKCLYYRAVAAGSPCSRAPSSVIRSNSFNSLWYFSCFSMVLIKFLIRGAERVDGAAARQGNGGAAPSVLLDPENLCAPEIIGKVLNSCEGVSSIMRFSAVQAFLSKRTCVL